MSAQILVEGTRLRPSLVCSVRDAVRWLKSRSGTSRMADTLDGLAYIASCVTNLRLYRTLFPAQFHASTSQLQPVDGSSYTDIEMEFFGLVDRHMFPIPEMLFWEGLPTERPTFIPICTDIAYCFDEDFGAELDEIPWPARGLYFLYDWQDNDLWDSMCVEAGICAPVPCADGRPNMKKFARLCRRAGAHFGDVPLAMNTLIHHTGIVWLDIFPEDYCEEFSWTLKDIRRLERQWRMAQKILELTEAVIEWLQQQPGAFVQIAKMWDEACGSDL
jgi:hypothetical protein